MDKQTAIDLLDNLLGMVEDNHGSDYDKAIHMGIDALKSNAPNALDCVERQAAKDAMRNLKKWYVVREKHKNIGFLYDDVMFTLDKLPSVQPRWIPVTERLPEDACQCIVTAKAKHVDNYPDYEVDTADFADGIFTTTNSWWGVESIIAWMPLPEPYKGGQDEQTD